MAPLRIVALEGDQTGQELLEQALRVLDPELLGLELEIVRFDLSLENRRATDNAVVTEAAEAMRETGLGLKAATITPEAADDVGSPNRILREAIDGKVIVRTGRRIPGVTPVAGVHEPISVCRMAVGDAYGAEQWREAERRRRARPPHRDDPPLGLPRRRRVLVPAGRAARRARLRRPEVDREPRLRGHAQGGDGRRRRAPPRGRLRAGADRRHPGRPRRRRRRRTRW